MGRYALISNGVVLNVIVAEQGFVDSQPGTFVLIGESTPASVGFVYDGTTFSAPANIVNPLTTQDNNVMFGQKLMEGFAILNQARGLTADQNYQLAKNLSPLASLLSSGDLKTFLAVLPSLPVDGVLLTSSIVSGIASQISQYLTATGQ